MAFLDASEPAACASEAASLKAQGFVSMKLGTLHKNDPAKDVARVAAIRDAIGPEGGILLDCFGSRWPVDQTLDFARRLEPYKLTWLEDPLVYDDLDGWARLTRESPVPIATGEWLYSFKSLKELIDRKACNVLILDLPRVGGFSGWKSISDYANGRGIRMANHLMPEISIHAMAATQSAFIVEYAPLAAPLFEQMPSIDQCGELQVPNAPGLGLTFNRDTLVRNHVQG
jgi:mandelate racemase